MRNIVFMVGLLLLASQVTSQDPTDPFSLKPIKRGMTFQATVWPSYKNNWAGKFACNNCNPFDGDVFCNQSLPLLCIVSAKSLQRPLYKVSIQYTPFAITDGGYYDGWTGGVFAVTQPVEGRKITSFAVGDTLCKGYFGPYAKFAEFTDGYYMPFMNQEPEKAWDLWDWSNTKQGGWNFWGYFNHHYRGRAWTWINGQPNGNCGN